MNQKLSVSKTISNVERIYPFLILMVVTFIMVFPWHVLNQRLPIWDSADFVLTIQKMMERLHGGFFDGLKALYMERGWRPILLPTLSVPFFMMSDGQIRLGVGLTQYVTVWLLASYLYLFLRHFFSSYRALIGSLVLVSAPWLINFSHVFYAELFWLAALAAVLYHLLYAYDRQSSSQFAMSGFWIGIMGDLRPVETLILLICPVLYLLLRAFCQKRLDARDSLFFVLQLGLISLASLLRIAYPGYDWAEIALLSTSFLLLLFAARSFYLKSPILCLLAVAEIIMVLWHFPTMQSLYFWAYSTSFGSLAQLTDQKFLDVTPWLIVKNLLGHYSPQLLSILAVLAGLGVVGFLKKRHDLYQKAALSILLAGLLMLLPMILLLASSGTSDMRRIMPAILTLYVGLMIGALSPNGLLAKTRMIGLSCIAVLQIINATTNGLAIQTPFCDGLQTVVGRLSSPFFQEDPNPIVLDGLLKMGITHGKIAAYSYCYRDYVYCEQQQRPMFEPIALATVAKQRHLPLDVHFIGDLNFDDLATLAAQIRVRGFNYVLIDMFDSPKNVNWQDPYVIHTQQFIAIQQHQSIPGLSKRGCFNALNRTLCLLEVNVL